MSLRDFIGALGRRWYIVLVCLLATGGLAWGATKVSPPEYTARGLVLLLPSAQAVATGGNPLLGLGGLDLPARVLVAHFESDAAQRDIERRAPEAEVAVTVDESTRGPVLAVDVLDSSPASALATMQYVVDEIPAQLLRIQKEVGAPAPSMVRSIPLTVDDEAQIDYGGLTRAVIAASALGLAVTALLVFVIDGLALRRRERRIREESEAAAPTDEGNERDQDAPAAAIAEDAEPVPTAEDSEPAAIAEDSEPAPIAEETEPAAAAAEREPTVAQDTDKPAEDAVEPSADAGEDDAAADELAEDWTDALWPDEDGHETLPEQTDDAIVAELPETAAAASDAADIDDLAGARARGTERRLRVAHLQAVTTGPEDMDGVAEPQRSTWRTP